MKYKVNFLMIANQKWCHVIVRTINSHIIHMEIEKKFGRMIEDGYVIYKIEAITE